MLAGDADRRTHRSAAVPRMLQVMVKRVGDQLSPGRVFAWVLDMKHLFENAPRRTDWPRVSG